MKVKNMTSSRGNPIADQFMIFNDKGKYFQSYSSIIVFIPGDGIQCSGNCPDIYCNGWKKQPSKTQLDRNKWDYSVTTGRYRNQFLGETKAETQKKIDSGEYELVDLNN